MTTYQDAYDLGFLMWFPFTCLWVFAAFRASKFKPLFYVFALGCLFGANTMLYVMRSGLFQVGVAGWFVLLLAWPVWYVWQLRKPSE